MRKPWNWQRCESFPSRTPDCEIRVATLQRVFLPQIWGSVGFLHRKYSRRETVFVSERDQSMLCESKSGSEQKEIEKYTYPHDA